MSFPRYPKYKDSGVEWLGQVPEHWDTSRLKNLFLLMNRLPEEGDEIVTAFRDGEVTLRSNRRVDGFTNAIHEHGYQRIQKGDLVIHAMDAFAGAIGISDSDGKSTPVYSVCTPKDSNVNPFYYGRLMRHMALSGYINSLSKGIRERSTEFRWNEASNVILAVPPITEQTRIVAFLDKETANIDALVAEQERLMALLKEKRQAVISHAVTKGLNPNAALKQSGIEWLGDVPEHWTVIKLGRAVFMQEGPGLRTWQFTDEGTRVICVTNITEYGIDFSLLEKFISNEEYKAGYRHFTVRRGDVLLSSSGNSWGKVAIYDGNEDVILNTSTIRINESEESPLKRDYIAMLLQSNTVREQLGLAMTGSCQPNFGPTHLNSVMVAIPSDDEQAAIVKFLKAEIAKLDTLTAEAQRAIDLLQERRTALISAAVTGQIDVRSITN